MHMNRFNDVLYFLRSLRHMHSYLIETLSYNYSYLKDSIVRFMLLSQANLKNIINFPTYVFPSKFSVQFSLCTITSFALSELNSDLSHFEKIEKVEETLALKF
jgi:hypothetical protein